MLRAYPAVRLLSLGAGDSLAAAQAGEAAQAAPEAALLGLRVGLQEAPELLGAGPPGEMLGKARTALAIELQRRQAGLLQALRWSSAASTPAPEFGMRSTGPGAGKAATGVPAPHASRITRPKVSVSEGKTNTSAQA